MNKTTPTRYTYLPTMAELYVCEDSEPALIEAITNRAAGALSNPWRGDIFPSEITHTLYEAHTHGYPLRLRELLGAPVFDLLHDVVGILRHYDEGHHRMHDCFLPRYLDTAEAAARKEAAHA